MTAADGKMAAGRGGDKDGLSLPLLNVWLKAVSGTFVARQEADGARNDPKPPRNSLTDPRDEEILTFAAPGRSWEYPIWEMSG